MRQTWNVALVGVGSDYRGALRARLAAPGASVVAESEAATAFTRGGSAARLDAVVIVEPCGETMRLPVFDCGAVLVTG